MKSWSGNLTWRKRNYIRYIQEIILIILIVLRVRNFIFFVKFIFLSCEWLTNFKFLYSKSSLYVSYVKTGKTNYLIFQFKYSINKEAEKIFSEDHHIFFLLYCQQYNMIISLIVTSIEHNSSTLNLIYSSMISCKFKFKKFYKLKLNFPGFRTFQNFLIRI